MLQLAAGLRHVCALLADRSVWCWGSGEAGQLADGSAVTIFLGPGLVPSVNGEGPFRELGAYRGTPTRIAGLPPIVDLVAGTESTCVLSTDRQQWCWGIGVHGDVGRSWRERTHARPPVRVDGVMTDDGFGDPFWSVCARLEADAARTRNGATASAPSAEASAAFARRCQRIQWRGAGADCARMGDGRVGCWSFGGRESALWGSTLPYVALESPEQIAAARPGTDRVCVVLGSRRVACTSAFAAGAPSTSPTQPRSAPLSAVRGFDDVEDLALSATDLCAVGVDRRVRCAPLASDGPASAPTVVPGLEQVRQLVAGRDYFCAVRADGRALCWGNSADGRLGTGALDSVLLPTRVATERALRSVSVGGLHTCALDAQGTPSCWGWNATGQVGVGVAAGRWIASPRDVAGLAPVDEVAAGWDHSCARRRDAVWCWGRNDVGQANGVEHALFLERPSLLRPLGDVQRLSIGGYNCALRGDGAVVSWPGRFAEQGPEFGRVLSFACAMDSACAVDRRGRLSCRGDVNVWATGRREVARVLGPVRVEMPAPSSAVAVGRHHACALGRDGRVACWGENDAGQLGDGTFTAHAVPARVADLEDVAAITAGGDVTCALQREGHVRCWGDNRWGQIGDGTTQNAARPTLVAALPVPVAGVATGGGHTCAWSDDGRAWCWGRNDQGQLGVGVVPAADVPNAVRFPAGR